MPSTEKVVLAATIDALKTVRHPRFLRSERGYQGRFYCALQAALEERDVLGSDLILEMEYQKGATRHGLTQRPDIVLHVPAEMAQTSVQENNLTVFALKRQASRKRANEDFRKLDAMCEHLRYPLAVFINIDSSEHHMDCYGGPYEERLHTFAVNHESGQVVITHAWRVNGQMKTETCV